MNFPPSGRLRWFSVCALLISSALFAAADAQRKPASMTAFVDVTRAAGIDFHLTCGGPQKLYIMESLCGGVASLTTTMTAGRTFSWSTARRSKI